MLPQASGALATAGAAGITDGGLMIVKLVAVLVLVVHVVVIFAWALG